MRRPLPALLLLTLASCAPDLPGMDGTIGAASRTQPYPRLLPLDPILAEGGRASRAEAAQVELRARGEALSATTIPAPGAARLEERGAALRARAAALRDAPI